MPLGSAHRLVPEATFLDHDQDADRTTAEAVFETLGAFSPSLAGSTDPTDVAFGLFEVGIDGLEPLWGREPILVERITAAIGRVLPGDALAPSAGIAGTRFTATMAAAHAEPGAPRIVPPGGEAAFLADRPADLLTTDADVRARLHRFGLRRIGAVAELPRSALVARFGEEGSRIHARACGQEIDPFQPRRTPERMVLVLPIEPATTGLEPLRFVLHRLVGALTAQLAGRGLAADRAVLTLGLDLAFAPRGTPPRIEVGQRFPEPTADPEPIERLLYAQLERTPPPAAVGRLELELRGAVPAAGQQLSMLVPQAAQAARLDWQLARIALTYGPDRVHRVAVADPDAPLPDGRATWRPAGLATGTIDAPRPAVTRAGRAHPRIDVELDPGGRPIAIHWNGRRETVEVCQGWRVEEAWWREPIARDYVKVVGEHWLALVYLDRISGTWHLERLYD